MRIRKHQLFDNPAQSFFCALFTFHTAGFLFDAYCSYNSGFLLMGAMIALSGAMLYPIPCIRNALSEVGLLSRSTHLM